MSNQQIKIQKTIYGLGSFNNAVDTRFSQLAKSVINNTSENNTDTNVDKFFEDYNDLFFDIPKEGAENSHQSLAYRSLQYLDISLEDLLNEIDILRQENTELKNQIIISTGIQTGDIEDV